MHTPRVPDVRVKGVSLYYEEHGTGASIVCIATSPDHSKIWVTIVGKLPGSNDRTGGVLELPAF
jgi:hypothetical protein